MYIAAVKNVYQFFSEYRHEMFIVPIEDYNRTVQLEQYCPMKRQNWTAIQQKGQIYSPNLRRNALKKINEKTNNVKLR